MTSITTQWIDVSNHDAWDAIIHGFADHDVYHRAAYSAATTAGSGRLLLIDDGTNRLALIIQVHAIPGSELHDAQTPYGYAGPLVHGDATSLWPLAQTALADQRIVNVFLRLSPFAPSALPPDAWLAPPHPTAWIPLQDGLAAAFSGGRCATHRSQVARAQRAGLLARTTSAPSLADLERFSPLYDLTMARLDATSDYRFGIDYYRTLSTLGDHLALVEILLGDSHGGQQSIQAAALFMRGPRWAHYHLSARADQAHNAAGDLLLASGAAWAHGHGCEGLHLGGGHRPTADDGLLAFKRRAGRMDANATFAGIVTDRVQHEALITAWQVRSNAAPRWFQAYRQAIPHSPV